MAAAVELATAYITIAASGADLAPSFGRSFKAVEKVADDSGKRMGKALTGQISKATQEDVDKAKAAHEKASKKVTATVETQAAKVEAARRKEEIAQAKVTEALAKYDAESSQVLAAQDRLAMATQKVEAAQKQQQSATERANRELEDTERQLRDTERAADSAARPFQRLGDRVKSALKGDFRGAFKPVEREGQEAADEIERDFKKAGDDSARGFGSSFKMGLGAALGGLTAYVGINEIFDWGKYAVSGAADLEQSIGGVQTVFKDSADQMLAWSEAADQSLGLTENEYNEYAAKLGASLKNAGTPMDELGDKTNWLIGMGADLASLYGGTTAEAVDALGSALRGEMDPIERYGISLNDAALTAEGLAMGITKTGGSFSTQEKQLIAMSLLQKQSADATGNFSREQDTASNVAQRLTAKLKETAAEIGGHLTPYLADLGGWILDKGIPALENFGKGIGGVWSILAGGDFKGAENTFGLEEDSAAVGFLFDVRDAAIGVWEKGLKPLWEFVKENLLPILAGIASSGIVAGISALAGAIGAAIAGAGGIGAVLGAVASAIFSLPVIIGAAVGALTWFFTETETGQQLVSKAWAFIQGAVAGVVDWFMTTAWPAILTGWDILKAVVAEVVPVIISYAQTLGSYWSQIVMGVIVPAIMQFVGYVRDVMFPIIQRLWTDYVQPVFAAIGAFIVVAWNNVIKPALTALFTFITETLAPTIVWLWQNVVSPAFTAIGSFIAWAWNSVIFPALDALKWFITSVLAPTVMWLWQNVIVPAWAGISWAIDTAWAVIQVIFAAIKAFIDNVLAPVFTWLWKNVIVPAWDGIKSAIDTTWTWLKDNVFNPLKNFIQDKVAPGFEAGVDAIGAAWDKLKSIAMAPVRFVVDSVINRGIIDNFNKIADTFGTDKIKHLPVPGMPSTSTVGGRKRVSGVKGASMAMATGGVLPGYTPGRDVHHFVSPTGGNLHLSGGEAIMRPEWTRAVGGPAAVAAMNARAREGLAFKDGGVLGSLWGKAKSVAGDALDTLLEGWDFATEALSDPGGALKKVAQAMLKNMPGGGGFKDMVTAVPSKIASVIGEKLAGLGDALGGGPVPTGSGSGGTLGAAESLAKSMGLSITSRGRRGARTAGSGSVSLHALGRAIDVAAPMTAAGKRLMMSFFNAASARWSPTELLYTPAGARNIHRGGGRYPNTGATARNHYNHVHIGFAEGGVLGELSRSWPAIQKYAGGGIIPGGVFDTGGILASGTAALNLSGQPEVVLNPAESRAYMAGQARTGQASRSGGDTFIGYGYTAEEVAREWRKEEKKREALYAR